MPELVKINFLILLDQFGNWNNHPILSVHDNDSPENKIIGAKARLQRYQFEREKFGETGVSSPNTRGWLPTY